MTENTKPAAEPQPAPATPEGDELHTGDDDLLDTLTSIRAGVEQLAEEMTLTDQQRDDYDGILGDLATADRLRVAELKTKQPAPAPVTPDQLQWVLDHNMQIRGGHRVQIAEAIEAWRADRNLLAHREARLAAIVQSLEKIVNASYTELRPFVEQYRENPSADNHIYGGKGGVYESWAYAEEWKVARAVAAYFQQIAANQLAALQPEEGR